MGYQAGLTNQAECNIPHFKDGMRLAMSQHRKNVQTGYDKISAEYTQEFINELEHKLLDRQLLKRFAQSMHGTNGPIADIGCGPGETTRYLRDQGIKNIFGLDLSAGMVAQARQANPDIEFHQGDMSALNVEDNAWAGIVAFYSIIHIPREDVVSVLQEFKRVLKPGGLLFFTFHIGQNAISVDNWWDKEIAITFLFFETDEMKGYLEAAGFEIEDLIIRYPYKDVEYQSQRAYIFARKPDFAIRPLEDDERDWVKQLMVEHWGSETAIAHNTVYQPSELSGFVAVREERKVGLVTYTIKNDNCEIVTLNSLQPNIGIGAALIDAVKTTARAAQCKRLWLITTNDNLHALKFYQKQGFEVAAVHRGAVNESRKIKPEIPPVGNDGIPLRDEFELELIL
jgi:ubiquinone/menaquinone biosynthesis C-methylase UbiE/N-acetylglutamate synthase-like GNAT family acetyltransferase